MYAPWYQMWKRGAGLLIPLLLLATACVAGERPGAALRRDFPAVAIDRIGARDFRFADFGDRAVLDALHRILRAGVPKDKIEEVILSTAYGRPGKIFRAPDGRPDAYDLWLRIAGCDSQVYMRAHFNGRVLAVHDKSGCLKQAAGPSPQ